MPRFRYQNIWPLNKGQDKKNILNCKSFKVIKHVEKVKYTSFLKTYCLTIFIPEYDLDLYLKTKKSMESYEKIVVSVNCHSKSLMIIILEHAIAVRQFVRRSYLFCLITPKLLITPRTIWLQTYWMVTSLKVKVKKILCSITNKHFENLLLCTNVISH